LCQQLRQQDGDQGPAIELEERTMDRAEKGEEDGSRTLTYSGGSEDALPLATAQDTLNPLNWPASRKRLLFLALMSSSILCDG
jgi:hypothetical protein